MLKKVYLGLGSNVGERAQHIARAVELLGEHGRVIAVSALYETEPVEMMQQPWFLNCAVALETELMPKQMLRAALAIEEAMGRKRTLHKGPRTIDIDILLFGSSVVEAARLTIPHPALHERRFVLEPLAEIAGEVRHPVLKKTVREMREALASGAVVRRYDKQKNPATDVSQ